MERDARIEASRREEEREAQLEKERMESFRSKRRESDDTGMSVVPVCVRMCGVCVCVHARVYDVWPAGRRRERGTLGEGGDGVLPQEERV